MWANAQRDGRPAEYRWCRAAIITACKIAVSNCNSDTVTSLHLKSSAMDKITLNDTQRHLKMVYLNRPYFTISVFVRYYHFFSTYVTYHLQQFLNWLSLKLHMISYLSVKQLATADIIMLCTQNACASGKKLHILQLKFKYSNANKIWINDFFSSTLVILLWSPYLIGQTIIFLPCDFYLSFFLPSFFFFLA